MHPESQPVAVAADWHRIVDANAERLWQLAVGVGLDGDAAAEVCQLAWLRLRLAGDIKAEDIPGWLDRQVRREATAAVRRRAARPRQQA
jgi:DNA-directed RNA polymerase specialized sigma24 family protein